MGHSYNDNNSKEIKKIITLEYNDEINGTKKSGRLFKNYLVTSRHFLCFSVGGGSTPT